MNEERLKQAYDKMTPDSQAEKRILGQIQLKGDSHMKREFTAQPVKTSRWAAIPAFMALAAVVALCAFAWTRLGQYPNEATDPTVAVDPTQDTAYEVDDEKGHEGKITVTPRPRVDIANIKNETLSVSIMSVTDSVHGNEIEVEVFTCDIYDRKDVDMLQAGDTIMICSQPVEIITVDRTENAVWINSSPLGAEYYLLADEDGYIVAGADDTFNYYSVGLAQLPVSSEFVFMDGSDPENPDSVYTFEEFVYNESLREKFFTRHNTTIVVEDGVVTKMVRAFTR